MEEQESATTGGREWAGEGKLNCNSVRRAMELLLHLRGKHALVERIERIL